MPSVADKVSSKPTALVDTSVAVVSLTDTSGNGDRCRKLVRHHHGVLAGHAAFETLSVLTRLPGSRKLGNQTAHRLIDANFGAPRVLSASEQRVLLGRLATTPIEGGSIYDALVGWAAVSASLPLITADRRALPTYRELGVTVIVIEGF
jgi:predicted nucleic acid-binding protein